MPLRKSISSARPPERPVLAPGWLIALMASLVSGALWLLYPRQDLERRLMAAPDTALSIAYLENLLRSDPQNPQLRLLLAQSQTRHGDVQNARATLQPALDSNNPELHRDALWTLWEINYSEYQKTPPENTPLRELLRDGLKHQLQALAQEDWPRPQQMRLGALTAQFNEPAVGIELNRQIATEQQSPLDAAQFYERAAIEALGVSDYASCAQLYLLARQLTSDKAQARSYFHAAVRALQSGNQPVAALELAEREAGDLANDKETLILLTELARAAGRPDIADRHARRLLKLSLLQQVQVHGAKALADSAFASNADLAQPVSWRAPPRVPPHSSYDDGAYLLGTGTNMLRTAAPAVPAAPPAAPHLPAAPFDDKVYTLGYDVFLENRKLEDAWAVAQAAVQQNPNNIVWRERLARVSEWTARPQIALQNWLAVARQTQKEEAWQAVLRLAPGQFDDAALAHALRWQLRSSPGDLRLVKELVAAYERLGEPQPALDYLEEEHPTPETLELWANLAERAGQPDVALKAWRTLLADPAQVTPERTMHAAILALGNGRPDEGLAWLESAQSLPLDSESAGEFLRMTGQLAESRQRTALATAAYRRLLATKDADSADHDALIRLLLQDHPTDAVKVLEQTWERYDEPRHLLHTLNLLASRSQWDEFAALLKKLDPAPDAPKRSLRALWKSGEYLRLAGSYYQNIGQVTQARKHLEAGLRLNPGSADMQQALLWLFIDNNDAVALRTLLTTYEMAWRSTPELHDSLAAAYQALSLPQTALDRYLRPHIQEHQNDFLWLMNYADALDQNQQTDQAWRLRRYLLSQQWQAARQRAAGPGLTNAQAREKWLTEEGLDQTRRMARTRLLLTQRPGDPALSVLRELLRLDRNASSQFSNATAETAIGWLQDAGEYTAERGFLWHQYARSRALESNRPLWAEITVALAEDDKAATGQLLQKFDERLPRYDRVNAARAVQDVRLAQTAAFDAANDQHDDQPLHLQLTENLIAFSDHAGVHFTRQNLGGMDETRSDATLHLALSPRVSLDLTASDIRRQATNANAVLNPPNEKMLGAQLRWGHLDGETLLYAGSRQGFVNTTPLQIEHEQRIDNRLTLRADLGTQLPSQESLALRVAGMKNRAALSLNYQATRQDRFTLLHAREGYRLQTGAQVGSGRHSSIEYSHTYRQETPLLEFGAFWSTHAYQRRDLSGLSPRDLAFRQFLPANTPDAGPGYFIPDNFSFYGVRMSTNMRYEQEYTRALQPFASVSLTRHSSLGTGYDVRLGLATSVWGADHLTLTWGLGKSGLQTPGSTRDVQLSYRFHF